MKNIDLTGLVTFQTQLSPIFGNRERQMVACKRACDYMLKKAGFKSTTAGGRIDMCSGNQRDGFLLSPGYDSAVNLLDDTLDKGKPVIVGVDRGIVGNYNANAATDHFVVIVARIMIGGKVYYQFYDPGTSYPEKGTHPTNLLAFDQAGFLTGTSYYNGKTYVVTEVRPTT